MKKYFALLLFVASGALIVSQVSTVTTYAVVPGDNDAVSVNTSGGTPSTGVYGSAISRDGRYVAFESQATDLVSPATNGQYQIFVRDRLSNTTVLVSVSSGGVQGNSYSNKPQITPNGRYVVFDSNASNLVTGDTNGKLDVFVHDLATHATQLVSKSVSGSLGNEGSHNADISADGKYVVFTSNATNLVTSPTLTSSQAFLKNLVTGEVKMVSQSASGESANSLIAQPRISCEGRHVIFQSNANNLVAGDSVNNPTKSKARVYVVDMLKGIDPMYITGTANSHTADAAISCSGDYITFVSGATNLVAGDTNGAVDVFVYDRINAIFERVSIATDGSESNASVYAYPDISDDGKLVTYVSPATNMVGGDTNNKEDVFIRNRQAGTTEVISKDASGAMGNGASNRAVISPDGRYVAFSSMSTNLVSGFGSATVSVIYASQTGLSGEY